MYTVVSIEYNVQVVKRDTYNGDILLVIHDKAMIGICIMFLSVKNVDVYVVFLS